MSDNEERNNSTKNESPRLKGGFIEFLLCPNRPVWDNATEALYGYISGYVEPLPLGLLQQILQENRLRKLAPIVSSSVLPHLDSDFIERTVGSYKKVSGGRGYPLAEELDSELKEYGHTYIKCMGEIFEYLAKYHVEKWIKESNESLQKRLKDRQRSRGTLCGESEVKQILASLEPVLNTLTASDGGPPPPEHGQNASVTDTRGVSEPKIGSLNESASFISAREPEGSSTNVRPGIQKRGNTKRRQNKRRPGPAKKQRFNCRCPVSFLKEETIAKHGIDEEELEQCRQLPLFPTAGEVRKHVFECHWRDKVYHCPGCKGSLKTHNNLNRHIENSRNSTPGNGGNCFETILNLAPKDSDLVSSAHESGSLTEPVKREIWRIVRDTAPGNETQKQCINELEQLSLKPNNAEDRKICWQNLIHIVRSYYQEADREFPELSPWDDERASEDDTDMNSESASAGLPPRLSSGYAADPSQLAEGTSHHSRSDALSNVSPYASQPTSTSLHPQGGFAGSNSHLPSGSSLCHAQNRYGAMGRGQPSMGFSIPTAGPSQQFRVLASPFGSFDGSTFSPNISPLQDSRYHDQNSGLQYPSGFAGLPNPLPAEDTSHQYSYYSVGNSPQQSQHHQQQQHATAVGRGQTLQPQVPRQLHPPTFSGTGRGHILPDSSPHAIQGFPFQPSE